MYVLIIKRRVKINYIKLHSLELIAALVFRLYFAISLSLSYDHSYNEKWAIIYVN